MKKIKIICSDLDGTLLNDDKVVSQKNIQAINDWQCKGNFFGITTGRSEEGVKLALKKKFTPDFIVCLNGARVHELKGTINTHVMDLHNVIKVLKIAESFPISEISLTKLGITQWYKQESLDKADKKEVEKISFKIKDSSNLKKFLKPLKKLPLTTTWSDIDYIEISALGVSKFTGLKDALPKEIDLNQVAAIGDYENDLEIVSKVGLGFAVGNALDELKKSAQIIVNDNNNNAIADMISHLNN